MVVPRWKTFSKYLLFLHREYSEADELYSQQQAEPANDKRMWRKGKGVGDGGREGLRRAGPRIDCVIGRPSQGVEREERDDSGDLAPRSLRRGNHDLGPGLDDCV